MIEKLIEVALALLFILPIAMLVILAQVKLDQEREDWENEEERQRRLKELYPRPSYEDRMGVRYGPQGASGASESGE